MTALEVTVELPDEAAMLVGSVTITSYLTAEGVSGYSVHTRGEMQMTGYLGLLTLGQHEIVKWRDEDDL